MAYRYVLPDSHPVDRLTTVQSKTPRAPRTLALLLPLLAIGLSGCRRVQALEQKCVSGDLSACEAACSKGIAGEGGCFHAGDLHRRKAELDFGGGDARQASTYFAKSCDGGYADGCLMAAEWVEAPFGIPGADLKADAAPPLITDAALTAREQKLTLACQHGSARGCKRLGDVLIGKNADAAKKAYGSACRAGTDPDGCIAARAREVALSEGWRADCTRGVADACSRLGDLLFAVDPPRALRLMVSECQLRGVEGPAGGIGAFVMGRIKEARGGIPLPGPAEPADGGKPARGRPLEVSLPTVSGQVAIVEVAATLRRNQARLEACVGKLTSSSAQAIHVQMVVDATGDVWRATVNGAPPAATRCLKRELEDLSVSRPASGIATVAFSLTPPAPAGKP